MDWQAYSSGLFFGLLGLRIWRSEGASGALGVVVVPSGIGPAVKAESSRMPPAGKITVHFILLRPCGMRGSRECARMPNFACFRPSPPRRRRLGLGRHTPPRIYYELGEANIPLPRFHFG
jgi:hypothetical protein